MDSQPWPLLSGLLFLIVLDRLYLPRYFREFVVCLSFGLVFSILASNGSNLALLVRAIAGYATLVVVYIAFYNYLTRYGFPRKAFIIVGAIWIALAVAELKYPKITSMLSPQRTSVGRGVTSLAPEPTFFALFLIFLSWIHFTGVKHSLKAAEVFLIAVYLISIVVLSRSAMGILYVGTAVAIYSVFLPIDLMKKMRVNAKMAKYLLVTLLVAASAFPTLKAHLEDSRIMQLASRISITDLPTVIDLVTNDASISARVGYSITSIHTALHNYLIPGGIDTFKEKGIYAATQWREMLPYFTPGEKIESWLGVMLFELGIFGALSILFLLLAAKGRHGAKMSEILIVLAFLVGAIPIAFPLVPMLFALWACQNRPAAVRVQPQLAAA